MTLDRLGSHSTCDEVLEGMDLTGRTMLVTGCNSGIGFETARSLAAAGARVVLACRSQSSADATAERIRALAPQALLDPMECDLASFASVRRCVESFPAQQLEVAICNAGLYQGRYMETADGIESTVGICHFGHFLLVNLLHEQLRRAATARVVMVSSESHRYPARLDFERFPMDRERFRALTAYGQAKLCNVLFANELERRWQTEGIHANALHPGTLIGTRIFRSSVMAKVVGALARPFTKSLAQGAATSVYCAVSPKLEGVGGRYYVDCHEKPASAGAHDVATAQRLWELSAVRVGLG